MFWVVVKAQEVLLLGSLLGWRWCHECYCRGCCWCSWGRSWVGGGAIVATVGDVVGAMVGVLGVALGLVAVVVAWLLLLACLLLLRFFLGW